MAKNLTMEELFAVVNILPYHKFKEVVDNYASTTKTDFQGEKDLMVTARLQDRLIKLGVNSHCPHCGSDIVVSVARESISRFCSARTALRSSRPLPIPSWKRPDGIGTSGLRYLLENDRHYKMDAEDFEVLKSGGYL